ncbi:LysR family transcriptional regulator [Paraburkholderia sp. J76]|uniref:LysR family transcriptional regulator n=1 Tax=Paraburkholderia sp. J76 TaxID=2805439 RepID=UPI002ABD4F37|nr:LysR family transcriptional regulator [Paraburkholderia sp. J76]
MHELSVRRLSHVVALAEELSFARAAERVHLTQPALSRSIQAIEEELDLRLFDRAARGVAVTPAGKMVVDRARRVLFEANCLSRDVELLKSHESGEVRIALGPYPTTVLMPDLLVEFAKRHPAVEMKIAVNQDIRMVEMLLAEEVDFLVLDRRVLPENAALAIKPMKRHEGAWFVRAGHPLTRQGVVSVHALRAYPLVSVPLPPFMRTSVQRLLKIRSHEKVALQLECNDLHVLKSFTERTDALLFATAASVRHELAARTLVPVPVRDAPRMGLDLALVVLAERTPSPAGEVAFTLAEELLLSAQKAPTLHAPRV